MTVMFGREAFEERRRARRRRVLKGAVLRFNNGYGAMECVVRNESENGAQLNFGDATGVPAIFELDVNGAEAPRRAIVRWRGPTTAGVELT